VHSTNFSPMSDCGRIVHSASRRKSWKPGSVISSTTAAVWRSVTSSAAIRPTVTPAIFTSSPSDTVNALRNSARTR
jgi:hypothetical protein